MVQRVSLCTQHTLCLALGATCVSPSPENFKACGQPSYGCSGRTSMRSSCGLLSTLRFPQYKLLRCGRIDSQQREPRAHLLALHVAHSITWVGRGTPESLPRLGWRGEEATRQRRTSELPTPARTTATCILGAAGADAKAADPSASACSAHSSVRTFATVSKRASLQAKPIRGPRSIATSCT